MFLVALASFASLIPSACGQSTIFVASAKPSEVDSNDGGAVELGVKFKSDTSGSITGLRFYKASTNTGTHVAHLWSTSGTLLGSATFTNETGSGWQQVNFAKPIAVSANTIYVASYFAPKGHYSDNTYAFQKAVDQPPLHALANSASSFNGVYLYSSKGGFPTNGWEATNYWVDVVFTTSQTPATPQLTLSATSLSFGSIAVKTSATKTLTLTSSGSSPVTVNSISTSGAGFSVVAGTLPVTLNPNQSLAVSLRFTPTVSGAASGQLTIASNSTTGSTTTVPLSGTGAAATPQLTLSATSLSFGSIALNTSATKTLTLTSSGSAAVTVSKVSTSGAGFSVVAGTLPVTLNPNQSLTVSLLFTPTVSGAASGQLTIASNSTTGSTTTVPLSGTGAAANPQLTVGAKSLSFGNVTVGTGVTQTLSLTSSGTSPLTVSSASITGAGFTLIGGSFPMTLPANQSTTLQVQFKPTVTGAAAGTLAISSNSSSGVSASVALAGTGMSVAHEVDLTWSPPSTSSDPIAGYHIYRSVGSGALQLMNSSMVVQTAYVDTTVSSGTTYDYVVKSVDQNGVESVPSNQIAVTTP